MSAWRKLELSSKLSFASIAITIIRLECCKRGGGGREGGREGGDNKELERVSNDVYIPTPSDVSAIGLISNREQSYLMKKSYSFLIWSCA